MCHTECFFNDLLVLPIGWRSPTTVFTNIYNFLTQNPREVLILDIQANDGTLQDLYTNVLNQINGFVDMMYKHPITGDDNEWPLMSELIDTNQRYVVGFFLANCLSRVSLPLCYFIMCLFRRISISSRSSVLSSSSFSFSWVALYAELSSLLFVPKVLIPPTINVLPKSIQFVDTYLIHHFILVKMK